MSINILYLSVSVLRMNDSSVLITCYIFHGSLKTRYYISFAHCFVRHQFVILVPTNQSTTLLAEAAGNLHVMDAFLF
jgi:hypothetical protein